jgi:hypothetical protein
MTVGVWGGLAQGDWDSSRVGLTGHDSGAQDLLDAAEPYTHNIDSSSQMKI